VVLVFLLPMDLDKMSNQLFNIRVYRSVILGYWFWCSGCSVLLVWFGSSGLVCLLPMDLDKMPN